LKHVCADTNLHSKQTPHAISVSARKKRRGKSWIPPGIRPNCTKSQNVAPRDKGPHSEGRENKKVCAFRNNTVWAEDGEPLKREECKRKG
jgi:hypothetical protein